MMFECKNCGYYGKKMVCPNCGKSTRIDFNHKDEEAAAKYFENVFRTARKLSLWPEEYGFFLKDLVSVGALIVKKDELGFNEYHKNGESKFWTLMTIHDYLHGGHIGCRA